MRPEAINLGAVVRRVEPDLDLVPCFNPSGTCRIRPVCALEAPWAMHLAPPAPFLTATHSQILWRREKELAGLLGVSSISVEMAESSTRRMPPASTRSRAHA